jgi:small subunit ribosomal protein S17
MAEENQADSNTDANASETPASESANVAAETAVAGNGQAEAAAPVKRAHRSQKVGAVVSDKMQKTVVVRVDRLVRHTKYRRYVRRTSKFMAHDELGATIGDKVRIVETRPMSARKRWRVIEIVQKAAK